MIYATYIGLLFLVVPIQATILDHVSILTVRPDLCLVAIVVIGFCRGYFDGLVMGILLGFIQDFFSAGQLGVNMLLKGLSGFVAGISSQFVANATAVTVYLLTVTLSLFAGITIWWFVGSEDGVMRALEHLWHIVLIQSLYDGVLASGCYRLIGGKVPSSQGEVPGYARLVP